MLILIFNIEVLGDALAVVGEDEVLDEGGQIGALGLFDALGDMADDDACALAAGNLAVRVHARLVLGEEDGVVLLSDVMIERSGTHKQTLGAYLVGYLGCQIGHGDGVLEGAGSHLAQLAQQSLVGVRQFDERHIGDKSEGLLDEIHERVGKQQEYAVDDEVGVHAVVEVGEVAVLHELQGEIDHAARQRHQQSGAEHLGTARQFAQRVDGHHAAHYLDDDELVLVFDGGGTDDDHRDVGGKGGARVKEDAHEDGRHHQRQDVDAEHVVGHHERHQHGKERHHHVEHQYVAGLGKVVLAEECQVGREERDEDEHKQQLAHDGRGNLGRV